MNKKFLDILVCPFDKVSSLELFEFRSNSNSNDDSAAVNNMGNLNNINSTVKGGKNDQDINEIKRSSEGQSPPDMRGLPAEIVEEGLLLCRTCLRFYPITEEIPIILPDELRDKKKDMEFLRRWKESIPKDLLTNLKPWTL